MRLVVADTSPLRYLVQIDQIALLPGLFEKIFIPSVVWAESPWARSISFGEEAPVRLLSYQYNFSAS